jgi:hypothetical protein
MVAIRASGIRMPMGLTVAAAHPRKIAKPIVHDARPEKKQTVGP